ncbi:hypothetical protein T439DRAFT_323276 [Meredithblackwellia eburnea MCA 4105]
MALASIGAVVQLGFLLQRTLTLKGENAVRLRAINNKVTKLVEALEEAQASNAKIGQNDLDSMLDGLNRILEHSQKLTRRLQGQSGMRKFFKADSIAADCQKLEREVDTELAMVTLACNMSTQNSVIGTKHLLAEMQIEMDQEYQLLQEELAKLKLKNKNGGAGGGVGADLGEGTSNSRPEAHRSHTVTGAGTSGTAAETRMAGSASLDRWHTNPSTPDDVKREELFRVGPRPPAQVEWGSDDEDDLWNERKLPPPTAGLGGDGQRGALVSELWGPDSDDEPGLT